MGTIGHATSVLALFGVCHEYLEYFKTAQAFETDYQILLLKLDLEHERFIIWAEKHGTNKDLVKFEPGGDGPSSGNVTLVTDALKTIESLLKNSRNLSEKYGVGEHQAVDEEEEEEQQLQAKRKFISTSAMKRFLRLHSSAGTYSGVPGHSKVLAGLPARTKWVIHHKTKFEVLVKDLRELIDGLYQILPVPTKERDKLVLDDLKSLLPDTDRIRQVELASEDVYTTWSAAASVIASASEVGSAFSVNLAIRSQVGDFAKMSAEVAEDPEEVGEVSELSLTHALDMFFVLTPDCQNSAGTVACRPKTIGEVCILKGDFPSFASEGSGVFSSLSRRIEDAINPSLPDSIIEILQAPSWSSEDVKDLALQSLLPAERAEIYCSPCACAVRTALSICSERSSKLLRFSVRVDERLQSSCSSPTTALDAMASLLQTIQLAESNHFWRPKDKYQIQLLKYLDRPWIEGRIYELELNQSGVFWKPKPNQPIVQLVAETIEPKSSYSRKYQRSIFIGGIDYLRPVLELSALPQLPRPPRVNEIYRAEKDQVLSDPWTMKYLGSFTPKNFSFSRMTQLERSSS